MILGILGRSGTNHLHDLLGVHPDLRPVSGLWEDHLVGHLPALETARAGLRSRWQHQPIGEAGAADLARSLGDGLVAFLAARRPDAIPLVKTPSPSGLHLVPTFLPAVRVVVIVRDARDVAESCVRTFGSTRQRWLRAWRSGAREILTAMEDPAVAAQARLVRYEDLVADRHSIIGELCTFLGLAPMTASPEELDRTPVRGSSDLGDDGTIHWKPVSIDEGFSPVQRYRAWTGPELRQADVLVGTELAAFGYEPTAPATGLDPATRALLQASHLAVSTIESTRARLRRATRRSRGSGS